MKYDFLSDAITPIEKLPYYDEATELVSVLATLHVRDGEVIADSDLSYGLLRALAAVHDDISEDLRCVIATAAAVLLVRNIPDDLKKQALENEAKIKLH
ncbi:hypothetical protein [Burkholderia cenocepacia]|uniref:hypothetical protein n=1 Tax=Burkholderia cenocepacia TaxID=95486 RepID=UPI00222FA6B5|nr:hypothetical protein [Burkholderia cenocepacia]MCW3539304.1 hypothetical protein [Burkholderia cenocepacia]